MTNAPKKKVNKKSLFLLLVAIIIICIIEFYRSGVVAKEGVYTIATIHKVQGARGGLRIDFSYVFDNKNYTGYAVNSSYSRNDVGKRFFIQVLPNDPERSLITDIEVPDSITEAPPEGWEKLPIR